MTRFETWAPVSTFRTSVPRQPVGAAKARASRVEAVTSKPRSPIVGVLLDVFGAIAIALLVPIFVLVLPLALIWWVALQTIRSGHSAPVATARHTEAASQWSVWK